MILEGVLLVLRGGANEQLTTDNIVSCKLLPIRVRHLFQCVGEKPLKMDEIYVKVEHRK